MPIELIVRRFESRKIDRPKPPATSSSVTAGTSGPVPIKLEWGKSWQLKVMNGSINIDETYYAVKKHREIPKK